MWHFYIERSLRNGLQYGPRGFHGWRYLQQWEHIIRLNWSGRTTRRVSLTGGRNRLDRWPASFCRLYAAPV